MVFAFFDDSLSLAVVLSGGIALGAALVIFRRHQAGAAWRSAIGPLVRPTGLVMSIAAIVAMTIYTPYWGEFLGEWGRNGGRYFNGNLIPLRTIRSYLDSTPSLAVAVQLLGNVALFMPLGFFLRLGAGMHLRTALALGFGAALLTEALQYLLPTGRAVDIDDVILNSLGVLAGALVADAVNRVIDRRTAAVVR